MTLLRGPPPFRAPYIHIGNTSLARVCILNPPPRSENSGDSRFLFEFPFGLPEPRSIVLSLPLCTRVVVASAVCLYLIRACVHACLFQYECVCVCAYERIEGRHCYPPPVPLLNFILSPSLPPFLSCRPTVPDLNVTVVSRATASPTRAGNQPIHARA